MATPRLEIYLDAESGVCIAKVERPNAEPRLIFDIGLEQLKSENPSDAAHRLGGTILNILALWHKEEFKDWKVVISSAEAAGDEDDYVTALQLIDQSLSQKSSEHIKSIDALLKQAATTDNDARTYFHEAWPLLRERMEKF